MPEGNILSAETETIRTRKWLSAEILLAVAVPLIVGGIAYGQVLSQVSMNSEDVKALALEEKATKADVAQIKTDVALIKQSVETIDKAVEKTSEQAEDNNKLMTEILRRLPEK